ncbi:FG-GAP-like repeat-containing protein [Occallatibacter riparius]|uniref:FG-GAP-like repeat-containing protein n=1 Tax=Occallatibacter riparius TaxID=1002689 RepID=A0A9J7BUB4_9BACT|nr:FG-GAP-like repeat-containing protein [Occallatibacter riparius]UWZ84518.1 FG-GAP-like repeat-containing protein [Occallatibacter riparius]
MNLLVPVLQAKEPNGALDLGIIVVPTMADAQKVLGQLKAGSNFAVLAKEKSTDATASDGGYLGKMEVSELRRELRDAVQGHALGELTGIVHLPSGFAILKVLAAPPTTEDLNPKRISSLLSTGAIRLGAQVSGFIEADTALLDYAKPADWSRDVGTVCQLRQKSLTNAQTSLADILSSPEEMRAHNFGPLEQGQAHSALAQLYEYDAQMDKAIAEWDAAYGLAVTEAPGYVPNLQESLGVSYLHRSELENDIYAGSRDLDIFPPLHPGMSYEHTEDSKKAIEYFTKYLEQTPNDLEVRWLLNLSYMTLGQYPAGVPARFLIPESDFHSSDSIGRFEDVAPAAGLNVMRAAGGVITDDFDNDGLLDIVVSSMDVCDPIRFFHNNGNGTFTDRTEQAGLMNQLGGLNVIQADYNNDGCMDLLILRGGWQFPQRKSLLRNNCNGAFTDVTDESGLGAAELTASQTGVWADFDNDGYLDLFVGNEGSGTQLFHNNGNGTFSQIGHAAGIDHTAMSKGVTAADYDHDGFVDLYVSNQNGANVLYHNNGNLTFTDVARQAGVQEPAFSFAAWFFDYDNDGWPDLWVNSYVVSMDEALKTYVGGPRNAEGLKLYRNKHDGTFEEVSKKVGMDKVFMTMGSNFGDVDNDGYLDIYLGVGQPSYAALLPHELLRNKEGKAFVDITESSGTGELHKGHGIAFADLTRQGREDIVAEIGGAVVGDKHTMRVFAAPANANDWINLRLLGVKTNREAAGAQIQVTVRNGDGAPHSIYRTVGQTSSFGGNPLEQNIGLGPHAKDVSIDIFWPTSGTHQHFTHVPPRQHLEIKEFATTYAELKEHSFRWRQAPATALASAQKNAH